MELEQKTDRERRIMGRISIYILTVIVVIAQLFTIGDRILGYDSVHPITVWTVAPSMILCFGILAILEAIDRKKE